MYFFNLGSFLQILRVISSQGLPPMPRPFLPWKTKEPLTADKLCLNLTYLTPSLGWKKRRTSVALCLRANEWLICQRNVVRTVIMATSFFSMPQTLSSFTDKLRWTQIASSRKVPGYCLKPMALFMQSLQTSLQKAKKRISSIS